LIFPISQPNQIRGLPLLAHYYRNSDSGHSFSFSSKRFQIFLRWATRLEIKENKDEFLLMAVVKHVLSANQKYGLLAALKTTKFKATTMCSCRNIQSFVLSA
jgi:hypothetical protein